MRLRVLLVLFLAAWFVAAVLAEPCGQTISKRVADTDTSTCRKGELCRVRARVDDFLSVTFSIPAGKCAQLTGTAYAVWVGYYSDLHNIYTYSAWAEALVDVDDSVQSRRSGWSGSSSKQYMYLLHGDVYEQWSQWRDGPGFYTVKVTVRGEAYAEGYGGTDYASLTAHHIWNLYASCSFSSNPPPPSESLLRVETSIDSKLSRYERIVAINETRVHTPWEGYASYAELDAYKTYSKEFEDEYYWPGKYSSVTTKKPYAGRVEVRVFTDLLNPQCDPLLGRPCIVKLLAVSSSSSRVLWSKSWINPRQVPSTLSFRLTTTLSGEKLRLEASRVTLSRPHITVKWNETYVFSYWTLYDSQGNPVNYSLNSTMIVRVPPGESYRAIAYYNSSASFAVLNVFSEPAGALVNYTGSHSGSARTPFTLVGPIVNVTLSATEAFERRVVTFNSTVAGSAVVASKPGVFEVHVDGCGKLIVEGTWAREVWEGCTGVIKLALWPEETLVFEGSGLVEVYRVERYRFEKWIVELSGQRWETDETTVHLELIGGISNATVVYNSSGNPRYRGDVIALRFERLPLEVEAGEFRLYGRGFCACYLGSVREFKELICTAPKSLRLPPLEEMRPWPELGPGYIYLDLEKLTNLPKCGNLTLLQVGAPGRPGNYSLLIELPSGFAARRVRVVVPSLSVTASYNETHVLLNFTCSGCDLLKPLVKDVELEVYVRESDTLRSIARSLADTPGPWLVAVPYSALAEVEEAGSLTLVARLEWERTGIVVSEELVVPVRVAGLEIAEWECDSTYFLMRPDVAGQGWPYSDPGRAYAVWQGRRYDATWAGQYFKFDMGVNVCRIQLGEIEVMWTPPLTQGEVLYPVRLKL